jgi:hypothetical protein
MIGVALHVVPKPPTGTISAVRGWVGDAPRRAQLALDAERAGQQHSTLLAELERAGARTHPPGWSL